VKTLWRRFLIAILLVVTSSTHGFVPHIPSHYDVSVGQTVVVQVLSTATGPDTPFSIASVDVRIAYDASSLAYVTTRAGSALMGGAQPPVVVPNDTGSEVVVAIAVIHPQPLLEDGVLLELEFVIQAGIGDMAELSLNEGAILQTSADVSDQDGIISTAGEAGAGSSILLKIIVICSRPGATC
jgi:hypothetical protein